MTIHANMGADQTELHIPKIHNHDGTTGSGGALTIASASLTATQTDIVLGRQTAGAGAMEEITCTASGRALLDDANIAAQRVTLGVEIGVNVQAWDAQLDDLAALTVTNGNTLVADGANWITVKNNFNGSGVPAVTDDSASGYGQGSLWYDLAATPDEIYRCTDATVGAAVWHNTSLTLSDLGSMASQNSNSIAVTGGTMEGTAIGGVTASTGDFTQITATGNADQVQGLFIGNATQTATIFEVRKSDNTIFLSIDSNGNSISRQGFTFGGLGIGQNARIYPTAAAAYTTVNSLGKNATFYNYDTNTVGNIGLALTGSTIVSTSGASVNLRISRSFSPTSGTANFKNIHIGTTINQTGGATGTTRAILITSTVTAASDYRAIEIGAVGTNHYSLLTNSGKVRFGDWVKIVGSQNINQLVVQANATQTNPLCVFKDSAGSELFRIHSNNSSNIFGGFGSGAAISSGLQNTGWGLNTLTNNSTGSFNSAFGRNSLLYNTTGQQNSAFGANGLLNSLGDFNSAFGVNALLQHVTGDNCLGLGVNAGYFTTIGNNTISSSSVYIGNNTKALNNNGTNEIVIGYAAIGIGSNTVVLGNDSIVTTRLKGKIQMGAGLLSAVGFTTTTADPTTTELTTNKDWSVHKNTTTGNVFLAYNDAGVIKKVQLV